MSALLRLALASAWNRRLSLGLTVVSVLLACTLLLSIERIREAALTSFAQSVSGTDLVVGARSSPLQLVLHAVFRVGEPTAGIQWDSYRRVASHPGVAWSIPLALGDSHRGYPVLGTEKTYFTHFLYADRTPLRFQAGSPFEQLFDVVLGAEVADKLGYRLGDRITLAHGDAALPGMTHEDKPFTVVGILAPTGTPVDRTLHVALAAIEAIHLDWTGGAPMPGLSIPADMVAKFDLQPKVITAFLLGLHQRSTVFSMQRRINGFSDEPLLAVMPGVALDQLWQTVSVVEQTLLAVSWLVLAVGLAGLVATMLAGLNERRREIAILRSVGAGPRQVLALLLIESLGVTLLGASAAVVLVAGLAVAGGDMLLRFGIAGLPLWPAAAEWRLLAWAMLAGALVGCIPAWRAYRLSLADGLIPRL